MSLAPIGRAAARGLVGFLLAALVGLGLVAPARAAVSFADVPPGSIYATEITWLADTGISTGWLEPDGTRTFRPLQPVARDAMAAFLYRYAGSPAFTPPATSPFSDIGPGDLFYREVTWAAARGITTGWLEPDGTRTFRPLSPIARDAMAAFLHRFAGSPAVTLPGSSQFWDVGLGDAFAREIHWLRSRGITTGWAGPFGCPTYRPLDPVNRDATAAFLYRFHHGGVTQPPNTCADQRLGRDWGTLPTTWPIVALTFNGGGSAVGTDRVLATLAARDVPTTFFVTGWFAEHFPSAVRAMAAAGHPVGNHSYAHIDYPTLSDQQIRDDLARGDAAIAPLVGRSTLKPFFRFPSAASDARSVRVVNEAGWATLGQTFDTRGWMGTSAGITVDSVCRRAVDGAGPGVVILLHVGAHPTDGSTLDADALPCIIDGIRARGFGFFSLDEFVR